jgi:hypothetical protein
MVSFGSFAGVEEDDNSLMNRSNLSCNSRAVGS